MQCTQTLWFDSKYICTGQQGWYARKFSIFIIRYAKFLLSDGQKSLIHTYIKLHDSLSSWQKVLQVQLSMYISLFHFVKANQQSDVTTTLIKWMSLSMAATKTTASPKLIVSDSNDYYKINHCLKHWEV